MCGNINTRFFIAVTGIIALLVATWSAVWRSSSQPAKGQSGPLRLVLNTSKATYLLGEPAVARLTLTNIGSSTLSVYQPVVPHSILLQVDDDEIIRGQLLSGASVLAPNPANTSRIAPGRSLDVSVNIGGVDPKYRLSLGAHSVKAIHDSNLVSLSGIWTGRIETSPATITVAEPKGDESSAFDLYEKIIAAHQSGFYPDNFPDAKAIALELMTKYPKSVYIPAALWKVLPQAMAVKRYDDLVFVAERYFSMNRLDEPYLLRIIGRSAGQAYYRLGNLSRADALLDKHSPGEKTAIRRLILLSSPKVLNPSTNAPQIFLGGSRSHPAESFCAYSSWLFRHYAAIQKESDSPPRTPRAPVCSTFAGLNQILTFA